MQMKLMSPTNLPLIMNLFCLPLFEAGEYFHHRFGAKDAAADKKRAGNHGPKQTSQRRRPFLLYIDTIRKRTL